MPSELRSAAARANGARSKGPATPEGKRKSSQNALSHGFTSRSTIILDCENPDEFHQMLAEYRAIYHPATAAEKDLVDQMVSARWRVRRLWTIETALLDAEIIRTQPQADREFPDADGGVPLALAFRSLADDSRALALISRYEARLSRMHDRAYAALREIQQQRAEIKKDKTNPSRPVPNPLRQPAQPLEDLLQESPAVLNRKPSSVEALGQQIAAQEAPRQHSGPRLELRTGSLRPGETPLHR